MAVDYLHRLLVEGPPADVRQLRADLWSEYPREVGGQRWTEVVPFSFDRLYALAPASRRVDKHIPYDPYDLSVWPIRRLSARRALLRYRFYTRNLEMDGLVRALSKARPALRFMLVSVCFDDSSVWTLLVSKGKARMWLSPERRHWDRARRRVRLAGDAVYESDEAVDWVEGQRLAEATRRWSGFARGVDRGRLNWSNQPVLRSLEMERELAAFEMLAAGHKAGRSRRRTRRGGWPSSAPRAARVRSR